MKLYKKRGKPKTKSRNPHQLDLVRIKPPVASQLLQDFRLALLRAGAEG